MRGDIMQEYFKQQADWIKTWQESQETLTKQYAGLSEEWMETMRGNKKKEPDFFEGWFKSQGSLEEQFREFTGRMNEMINKVYSNKLPPEVLKFMNISFFEEFYKNWLHSFELPGGVKNPLNMNGGWQQATNFFSSVQEKGNPFFSAFGSSTIIDQMNRVFGMLQGTLGQKENAFGDIMNSCQGLFGKMFESTTAQGTEKLAEGFENWTKEVEKLLSAPKLGINREMAHYISQALVMSQNFFQTYTKMARLVEATSRKAGSRFQTKLSEAAINNKPVNKFTDLCALWTEENEAVFLEVMGGQEFAKIQGDFVNAGHQLKIQWNRLAEKALEPTPIALKRDLDLAINEIHQMKRDMKTFKREFIVHQKEALATRNSLAVLETELKNAKASETAALEEANKARVAEAAVQEEVRKLKHPEVAIQDGAKQDIADDKTVKASARATTKTKSKNV